MYPSTGWMGWDGIKLSAFGNWLKHLRIAINYKTRHPTASQSHIVGDWDKRGVSQSQSHIPIRWDFRHPVFGFEEGSMDGWIEECIIRSCYYSLLSANSESWRHSLPSYRKFITMSQFDWRDAEESVEVVCEELTLINKFDMKRINLKGQSYPSREVQKHNQNRVWNGHPQ